MIVVDQKDKQLSFDFEPAEKYGLKINGEFLRVYYSSIYYGLIFKYSTYQEAETARKKYTRGDEYTIEVIPQHLLYSDELTLLEREYF